ncbi:MAG: hypothetical protein J3K34DRAFT_416950 [Monoraphidium minutum]|nr:MAG: hypothetical protein J3K34DRAFT_416950 [Monoraphidium minutum]
MQATMRLSSKAGACAWRSAPTRKYSVAVRAAEGHINPSIKKDVDKVVDMMKVEELPKKAVFCRCWRSGTFPMCDGKHAQHNKETGDNVGPLIISKE